MLLPAQGHVPWCKSLNAPVFRLNHTFHYGSTRWEGHHPDSCCSGDRPGSCLSKLPSLVCSLTVEVLNYVDRFHGYLILLYFFLLTFMLLLSKVTKRKVTISDPRQMKEWISHLLLCDMTDNLWLWETYFSALVSLLHNKFTAEALQEYIPFSNYVNSDKGLQNYKTIRLPTPSNWYQLLTHYTPIWANNALSE